ncbi:ADP-forming succinate--CoA ligase subunit beta [Desulfofustis glycolicus]|uniref:Succinate--CoA ligase [ADP-forming] subunit beta n=1 Tax=Desulfofustis glycolicus DSM 9705 TaxID=1121409 RepID=A0A1M5VFE9_9BACT|nr:ADP-forming succinate--CoA ligase subunit beta [Desulfofustis glycolicus]SHH73966.1 succinyl-CoA synthetase (ADP-forming) beta subunit [Desulfofustis glycolicus DSM 9705]
MKIHEYQAKELFRNHGVVVPDGMVCDSPDGVTAAVASLGLPVAVKAQVHAGGRGKGGGVRLAKTETEARAAAQAIIGMELVTQQTGSTGKRVHKVLVERGVTIKQELYLSLIVNRDDATITIIASPDGGMDIEEVAARTPERIVKVGINPLIGIKGYHAKQVASALGLTGTIAKQLGALLGNLYRLFVGCDCSLVEINPLIITGDDQLLALDAKMDIDSNSLFRHPEIAAMRDPLEEDPQELEAAQFDLNYIKLDGSIGNMVNGAGLAMATMDLIKQAGAEPANFLDVGGGATAEKVENGFRIILSDPHVKGILINIFGGILRCDVLAQGVVQAAGAVGLNVPVVVRMEGTNVEEGRRILAQSGLDLINAVDLSDAAGKVAAIAGR